MGKKKWTAPNERRRHNTSKRGGGRGGGGRTNNRKDEQEEQHTSFKRKEFGNKERENVPFDVKNSLFERDVGVTEFAGKTPGFTGVIKARFSDFQVNEIDVNGVIAKLTDQSMPTLPTDNDIDEEVLSEHTDEVIKLISQEIWDKTIKLSQAYFKSEETIEIDATAYTKEQRSLVHNTVKEIFKTSINSKTVPRDDKKFIVFGKYPKNVSNDRRTKWLWPHEYTYFLLHKENLDTMKAATDLAQNLNTNVSALAYAGTKDKRAKTTQWFCIRKRDPAKIIRAVSNFSRMHVGNFTFKPETLKLGLLKGNRFRIALRHITEEESIINKALESFKSNGFINYYGLQRFGNSATVPTHTIGEALLRGEFKDAVELILKPRDGDQIFMAKIRENWWKYRDATQTLKMFYHTNRGIEAKLLAGLAKNGPNDYVNALENIPRNMRLMYIHAYQSLVWNEIVSKRIKKYDLNLQQGDLVFVEPESVSTKTEINEEECADEGSDFIRTFDDDVVEDDDYVDEGAEIEKLPDDISRFRTMVKPLTAEDIASGKYSIFDVVLPLPGHDITYPSNECSKWYEERLAKDGLSSELLKTKQKTYSLTGAYRKMLIKPENVSWSFIKYKTANDNLIQSDMEELLNENVPENAEDGEFKALIMDFCLPSSTYATMALREILKEDTSAANQTKINQAESGSVVNADDDIPDTIVDGFVMVSEKELAATETDTSKKRKLTNQDDNETSSKKSK